MKGNENELSGCCPGPLRQRECDSDPAPPLDNSSSDEKRVCTCENIEEDYGVQAQSAAACVQDLRKEEDSADCLRSKFVGDSTTHQTSSCGEEGEETDRVQDSVCEAQNTAEGPKREVQAEGCNSVRPEQDQLLEDKEQRATTAAEMGITQSLDTPESSDVESCSQGTESNDEKDLDNKSVSSLEPEEKGGAISKEPVGLHPAVDQPSITSCENNSEKGARCISPSPTADALHSFEEQKELDASEGFCEQTAAERFIDEQEKPGEDSTDGQEESTPVILCTNAESLQEQSDTTGHHGDTSDGTEERYQENDIVEMHQAPLEAERDEDAKMCNSGFELDSMSPVTLNDVLTDSTHSPEQKTETSTEEPPNTGEVDPLEVIAIGIESERQKSENSGDVSQPEVDSEPESPTPSSEDTLEPEETDCCTKEVEGLSCNDQQESQEQDTPIDALQQTADCQAIKETLTEDTENKNSLESQDCFERQTGEITLEGADAQLMEVIDLFPFVPEQGPTQNSAIDQSEKEEELTDITTENCQTAENNQSIPEQETVSEERKESCNIRATENSHTPEDNVPEQRAVSQNSAVDQSEETEELCDTTATENNPTVMREQLELSSDHSDSVGCVLSTTNVSDTVDISFSLEEQSSAIELRRELNSEPGLVDTHSEDVELTEALETLETATELQGDTHTSGLQKGELFSNLKDKFM